jgi:hypothetical protein
MKKNMPFISIGFALILTLFLVASIKSASYAADDNTGICDNSKPDPS